MRALCDQQTKDDKFCGQLTSDKGLKKLFLEFITPKNYVKQKNQNQLDEVARFDC